MKIQSLQKRAKADIRSVGWGFLMLVLASIMLLSSCDEFLKEDPDSLITPEEFFLEAGDAQAAVDAIYTHLGGNSFYGQYYWLMTSLASDDGVSSGFHPEMAEFSEFSLSPHNPAIAQIWSELYAAIYTANFAVDRVPTAPISEGDATLLVAESRFMRGLLYFDLVRLFGEVPLVREATTDGTTLEAVVSAPIDSLYQFIEADFTFASDNLPTKGTAGRPGAIAAVGFLAKLALTRGEYNRAFQLNRFIIQSNQYSLEADYASLFQVGNNNNSEVLFAIPFGPGDQAPINQRTLSPSMTGQTPWGLPTTDLDTAFSSQDRRATVTLMLENGQHYVSKFWDQTAEPDAGPTSNDLPVLRYADILLMHAEAINELRNGSNSEGLAAINAVRERARFDGTQSLDILPNLPSLNYQDFKAAILRERRTEFAWEGHRWFDLIRFGELEQRVQAVKPGSAVSETHRLLPIPQKEIDLNPLLQQNPGY